MKVNLKPAKIESLLGLVAAAFLSILPTDAVTIGWDANPEPDIASYSVFYGAVDAPATRVNVGNVTTASITNLTPGITYFFYVTAINTAGLESDPSDQITYTEPVMYVPFDPAADVDGDGFTELEESYLGTDPANAASTLAVTTVASSSTSQDLQFKTVAGKHYTLEYNDNFPSGLWQTLVADIAATGTVTSYSDTTAPLATRRIYRLRSLEIATTIRASDLAGFHRFTFKGSSDTLFSLPFTRPPAALGKVASVSGSTVQVSGSLPWTANSWVYAPGTQTNTYYLYFRSGSHHGEYYTITGNGSDTLTVDVDGGSLSGVAAGDLVSVIPYWTLGTVFPAGKGVHASATSGTRLTEVYFPKLNGVGVNGGVSSIYYFRDGSWRRVGEGLVVKNDDVILPDMFVIVRNNVGTSTEVVTHGSVLGGDLSLVVKRNSGMLQDNILALPRPVSVSLNDSGLVASGAFRESLTAGTRTDELYVYDNSTPMINRSPSAIYYYRNGGWRKVGAGNADVGAETVFTPGSGFIIRSASGLSTDRWNNPASY